MHSHTSRALAAFAASACLTAAGTGLLENPPEGAAVSGIALVSGWHCEATRVEVAIDNLPRLAAAHGTDRPDTVGVCAGKRSNGFGLLVNWADWGPGTHVVRVFADGVEFGSRTVTLVDLGAVFLTGKSAQVTVNEFPTAGRSLVLEWREGTQSFAARELGNAPALSGTWNGANLERRSNCTNAQNNGTRGTYAQWIVSVDPVSDFFRIQESTITGLTCAYTGTHRLAGNRHEVVDGSYSCSDGKQGSFRSTDILVGANALSIRLAIKLSGSESCDIDALVGGSRF